MHRISVIGIGGTGMRCLESFIHLCAAGMFDDHEVTMLALDTDAKNGNFRRVKALVDDYSRLSNPEASSGTFFSAKIKYLEFSPNYTAATFNSVTGYTSQHNELTEEDPEVRKSDVVDLFLSDDVRAMNLEHGYRAQTHMGSLLMYRAIIEEAIEASRSKRYSPIRDFLDSSGLAAGAGGKVFIFGSVFGGTGASSIPVVPRALNIAQQLLSNNYEADILRGNLFSTVVLTHYFTFTKPPKTDAVIADSNRFALNSQAALMFYESEKSIRETYERLYLIGREDAKQLPDGTKTDTGGADQENPADFIELLAAFAAYDFFKAAEKYNDISEAREKEFKVGDADSKFVVIQYEDVLKRMDFTNFTTDNIKFRTKMGALLATALTQGRNGNKFFEQMVRTYYKNVDTDKELPALVSYFDKFFSMGTDASGQYIQKGWAQQMSDSVHREFSMDVPFLFNEEVFDSSKPISKKKYNEKLFVDDGQAFRFSTKGMFGDTLYNAIRDALQTGINKNVQDHTTLHQLIKDCYDTFVQLYGLDRQA